MNPLPAEAGINQLWYMAPLVVAISLVYGAMRHEYMIPILRNALCAGWWILSFMGLIFLFLVIMTWLV